MAWNMVIAASETADIFTLGNDVFTEILTALFMMAVIVCAVILGGKQSIRCWLHFPNFVRMGVRLCLIIQMRISLMLPKSVCRTQL